MTDLLLKFPSAEIAGKIGEALGCATKTETGWNFATTHKVAICPIGAHHYPSGSMVTDAILGPYPVMISDQSFWALVRIIDGIPTPAELTPYLVIRDPADITQPQQTWA